MRKLFVALAAAVAMAGCGGVGELLAVAYRGLFPDSNLFGIRGDVGLILNGLDVIGEIIDLVDGEEVKYSIRGTRNGENFVGTIAKEGEEPIAVEGTLVESGDQLDANWTLERDGTTQTLEFEAERTQ